MPESITPRPPFSSARPARPALPTSVEGLPALDPAVADVVAAELERLGLELPPGVQRALDDQVRLLVAWNEAVNLTAIRDPLAMAREHVVDSLTALPLLHRLGPPTPDLLDLGSGAGYPGLPLGLALPARGLALVESVGKKARFLEAAAGAARLALFEAGGSTTPPAIEVRADRAEALGRDPAFAGGWDIVTARAVGPLSRLVELSFPLLRPGGLLVAWKRDVGDGRLAAELEAAEGPIRSAGGRPPLVESVVAAGLEDHRLVVVHRLR